MGWLQSQPRRQEVALRQLPSLIPPLQRMGPGLPVPPAPPELAVEHQAGRPEGRLGSLGSRGSPLEPGGSRRVLHRGACSERRIRASVGGSPGLLEASRVLL
jgi:hypothetical protein